MRAEGFFPRGAAVPGVGLIVVPEPIRIASRNAAEHFRAKRSVEQSRILDARGRLLPERCGRPRGRSYCCSRAYPDRLPKRCRALPRETECRTVAHLLRNLPLHFGIPIAAE